MYQIKPSQVYPEILATATKGLVPFFKGSPGIGKSNQVAKFCRDFSLKLIDVRISTMLPEDLNGMPFVDIEREVSKFIPFDTFPLKGQPVPEGFEGWCIFLDELTSADKPMQAATYKVILDKMVSNYDLHEKVIIVAAGNLATDKAVVNQMSTALQSRVIHYEMAADADEFIEHAIKAGFDYRVPAFISYVPQSVMDFRPDHTDHTFACPRTWEFVSRIIKGENVDQSFGPRIAGTIGSGMATEFISFCREFDKLPKYEDIVKDPSSTPVPAEMSTKYAAMGMLGNMISVKDLKPVLKYVDRFDMEMRLLFGRSARSNCPDVEDETVFWDHMSKVTRFAAA